MYIGNIAYDLNNRRCCSFFVKLAGRFAFFSRARLALYTLSLLLMKSASSLAAALKSRTAKGDFIR